jgi:polyhydroxyalkanoate synthesis regulator phasin
MLDNDSKSEGKNYRSPARKLIKFFEESRDQWKAKCVQAKYQIKLLSNKIRYLEKRKADLTTRVKELEKEVEALQEKKR